MKQLIVIAALTSFIASAAPIIPPEIDKQTDDELKALYWKCDLSSMTGFLGAKDAATCSSVYEKLLIVLNPPGTSQKERYMTFLAWWNANKAAEHAKLGHSR